MNAGVEIWHIGALGNTAKSVAGCKTLCILYIFDNLYLVDLSKKYEN